MPILKDPVDPFARPSGWNEPAPGCRKPQKIHEQQAENTTADTARTRSRGAAVLFLVRNDTLP